MDYQVSWSPEALEDVDAIASYISRDSTVYAQAVVDRIIETSRRLKDFPLLGRMVPELGDEHIRERCLYSYRMIYRIQGHQILIVAVIHGKRLLEAIDERFDES